MLNRGHIISYCPNTFNKLNYKKEKTILKKKTFINTVRIHAGL